MADARDGAMTSPRGNGKLPAYGGVIVNGSGEVLLRRPSNGFDGYAWTFAKGGPKHGQTPQEAALCEVLEETGWVCDIVAPISGWFDGGSTATRFFLMRPRRDTGQFDSETEQVIWVPLAEARSRITETTNPGGRKRDLAVLDAAIALVAKVQSVE